MILSRHRKNLNTAGGKLDQAIGVIGEAQILLRTPDALERATIIAARVGRIVETVRCSASATNARSWHSVVVEDRTTMLKLGALIHSGPGVARHCWRLAWGRTQPFTVFDASCAIHSRLLAA